MINHQHNSNHCDVKDQSNSNLIQTGVVVKIEHDFAVVKVSVFSACVGCHSKCTLSSEKAERFVDIPLLPDHPYTIGEQLDLQIDSRFIFSISFLIYLIPTLLLIIFAAIGWRLSETYHFADSNLGALIGIGISIPVILLFLAIVRKRYARTNQIKVIPRCDVK